MASSTNTASVAEVPYIGSFTVKTRVKWWGGWTEKDPAEKIREYLWAETQYESSFGYMLWHHGSKTHGDTSSTSLSLEVQVIRERFESAIQSMDSRYTAALAKIEKENQELRQQLAELGDTFAQQLGKATLHNPNDRLQNRNQTFQNRRQIFHDYHKTIDSHN
ncbi:hypothetical protein BG005_012021 [Podila minutissima]|nr:hypothetical protein BG005_012021 [Podila minutissima]